ncbi:MAG: hypothetical protein ACYTEL_14530 [Planctomycetota bacterium]|jgi:hypothetical protein
MNNAKLLLNAYYEALHERLETHKELLAAKIERLLGDEIAKRHFSGFDAERLAAYRDACLAFVDERIEAYNPIGIQYTFDHARRKGAAELELQLNWYDSRAEFDALKEAALAKTVTPVAEQELSELVDELVSEVGAFPDKSILSTYEAGPALAKLPDYIVAQAIEEIIK